MPHPSFLTGFTSVVICLSLDDRGIRMAKSDMEILEILLSYWVKHNQEHTKEFKKWAERAKHSENIAVHDDILMAVEQTDNANESLLKALERLTAILEKYRSSHVFSVAATAKGG